MNAPNAPLRGLIVEDSENDASLLEIELERAGYEPLCQRVETQEVMIAALERQPWDVVIADYVLPDFNGLSALSLVKQKGLDLPFIIVSGHITEDTAVAAMKAGAHDYVMKDKLARLGPAVERELREARIRRERRRFEEKVAVEHGITRILASGESLDEAAPEFIKLLLEGLGMEVGALWLVDAERGVMESFAMEQRTVNQGLRHFVQDSRRLKLKMGAGLAGRVWEQRRAVYATDLSPESNSVRREQAMKTGLRSAMAFPIQSAGEFVGVLEFFSSQTMDCDMPLLNMMTAIGSGIGQFIRRRAAEEHVRRANDELELRVQRRTTELKTANSRLETAISDRKRLEHELLEITEKERRRIALDLHDDLGQRLSGIALMTKGLELKLAKSNGGPVQDAAQIHNLVQEAITHTREVAKDLATLDLKGKSLPAALEELAQHAGKLLSIRCMFVAKGKIPSLDQTVVIQLYKIAQEAVTNAFKHGKAKRVNISLSNGSDKLVLAVQNSGKPFPDLQTHSRTGMGLRIMEYRASLIGASLEIKAARTSGSSVTCTVPLEGNK